MHILKLTFILWRKLLLLDCCALSIFNFQKKLASNDEFHTSLFAKSLLSSLHSLVNLYFMEEVTDLLLSSFELKNKIGSSDES